MNLKFEKQTQLEPGVWLLCRIGRTGKRSITAEYVTELNKVDGVVLGVKIADNIVPDLPGEFREAVMPGDYGKPVLVLDEFGLRDDTFMVGGKVVGRNGEYTLVGNGDRIVSVRKVLFESSNDADPQLHDNDQSRKVGDGDPENSCEGQSAVCAHGLQ